MTKIPELNATQLRRAKRQSREERRISALRDNLRRRKVPISNNGDTDQFGKEDV